MVRFMLIGKKKGTPQNGKTFKLMEVGKGGLKKVFILNIRMSNWSPCVKGKIFGVKVRNRTPSMNVGDILLARLLKNGTEEYGAKGL